MSGTGDRGTGMSMSMPINFCLARTRFWGIPVGGSVGLEFRTRSNRRERELYRYSGVHLYF